MFVATDHAPLYKTVGDQTVPYFWDASAGMVNWQDDRDATKPHVPIGMNFYIDMAGNVYMKGSIYGEDGYFKGKLVGATGDFSGNVTADNFYFNDGGSIRTLISNLNNGQSKVDFSDIDYIDLGGLIIDGREGSAGIRFNPGYEPIKYQFGTTSSGPWHDTMAANDKYRRDSLDGGTTWGSAYQFRGTDGRNGSDASVTRANIEAALKKASTISESYIGVDSMGSPEIYGGNIYGANIYAGDGSGSYAHMDGDSLRLYAQGVTAPKVKIDVGWRGLEPRIDLGAGDGSEHQIFSFRKEATQGVIQYSGYGDNFAMLTFNEDGSIEPITPTWLKGTWDFTNATVKGIYAVCG